MKEWYSAALTAFFGVLVFVIGQFLQRFLLEPIQDLRKTIGEIANALVLYANAIGATSALVSIYADDLKRAEQLDEPYRRMSIACCEDLIKREFTQSDEAKRIFRQQASDLIAKSYVIPAHWLFSLLGWIPPRKNIVKVSSLLIRISNSNDTSIHSDSQQIAALLKIKPLVEKFGKPAKTE